MMTFYCSTQLIPQTIIISGIVTNHDKDQSSLFTFLTCSAVHDNHANNYLFMTNIVFLYMSFRLAEYQFLLVQMTFARSE